MIASQRISLDFSLRRLESIELNRATLLYTQGMLLRTLGREKDAQTSFADALGANPPPMTGYLALVALRRR